MGLQRKTGAEIQTQVWQPCKERILRLRPESGPHGLEGEEREPCNFGGEERGPHSFGMLVFATRLRQQERLCQEEKRRKDSCW